MKRILIGLAAIIVLLPIWIMTSAQYSTTSTYATFRTVTSTEDTQLTASTQQTAPVRTADGTIRITHIPVGAMHVRFKGTTAADKTLSWTLWAYKSTSAPAKYVAHGTATTGATETGNTNEYYCDTISITDQQWFKTVATADGAPETIVSGGGISELVFDTCEFPIFKIIIRDIGGGGAEATTAGADYCTFY